jgi:ATP-dependent DNA ligase
MMPGGLSSNELLFGRCRPTYVAFDLLMADGVDLRPLPR